MPLLRGTLLRLKPQQQVFKRRSKKLQVTRGFVRTPNARQIGGLRSGAQKQEGLARPHLATYLPPVLSGLMGLSPLSRGC
eukprot:1158840-Pelagomonas_calceolata.AAC.3